MTADVIEFAPLLKRKQAAECDHLTCLVGMNEASVSCSDCDAELDPWWVLRSLVERSEELEAADAARHARNLAALQEWEEKRKEAMRLHEAWVAGANSRIEKLTAEINRLMAQKLRLANDPDVARARRSKGQRP
jgi:hypothetical protein